MPARVPSLESGPSDRPRTYNQWGDNFFLHRIWRRREGQLLKLLSVRNLKSVRMAFEKRANEGATGATVGEFVQIMFQILGVWSWNKDELVIQLLELFSNIDVNQDKVRVSGAGSVRVGGVRLEPPSGKPKRSGFWA